MCGIVGYIGSGNALDIILSGLQKLEYRGYDSAGVAIYRNGEVQVSRAEGKLKALRDVVAELSKEPVSHLGIGHTRWATHGKPSEINAHPHTSGRVSLIHNGIIENYIELRERLKKEGRSFISETDTEIATCLLDHYLQSGLQPFDALKKTCGDIRGSYAFLAIDSEHPDRILVAKNATPIVIGIGEGEIFVASDIPAILNGTRKVMFLEDGDLVEISLEKLTIENNGVPIEREVQTITWDPVTAQKGGFKHFMLKEIHEQSQALADTFRGRISLESSDIVLPEITLTDEEVKNTRRIVLLACGTAWHACLVAKYYLEKYTRIPCEVDYASEFRYRDYVIEPDTMVMVISQSGETADTLAALEKANGNVNTLAVCNVLGSTIARKAKQVMFTQAGPEISVASTKAFTTQLVSVYLLALYLGQKKGIVSGKQIKEKIGELVRLPAAIDLAINSVEEQVQSIAREYHRSKGFLFLGRGNCYPIALEGALKLKEISYIHAEGYPSGEMKHGPIALIDEDLPVVVVLQRSDILFEKTLSNLREVESRGGQIITLTDVDDISELKSLSLSLVQLPHISEDLSPIVLTIPMQLLAYHVADFNGTDVDLPRNLAKSVTVE